MLQLNSYDYNELLSDNDSQTLSDISSNSVNMYLYNSNDYINSPNSLSEYTDSNYNYEETDSENDFLLFKTNEFKLNLLETYSLYLERNNNKLYKQIIELTKSHNNNTHQFKITIDQTMLDFNNSTILNIQDYKYLKDDFNKLTNDYHVLTNDYIILKNKFENYQKNIQNNEEDLIINNDKEDNNIKKNEINGFNSFIYNLKLFSWL